MGDEHELLQASKSLFTIWTPLDLIEDLHGEICKRESDSGIVGYKSSVVICKVKERTNIYFRVWGSKGPYCFHFVKLGPNNSISDNMSKTAALLHRELTFLGLYHQTCFFVGIGILGEYVQYALPMLNSRSLDRRGRLLAAQRASS